MPSLKVQQKRARRTRMSKAKRRIANIAKMKKRQEEGRTLNQEEMLQVIDIVNKARKDPNFNIEEWEFRGSENKVKAAKRLLTDMLQASREADEKTAKMNEEPEMGDIVYEEE